MRYKNDKTTQAEVYPPVKERCFSPEESDGVRDPLQTSGGPDLTGPDFSLQGLTLAATLAGLKGYLNANMLMNV